MRFLGDLIVVVALGAALGGPLALLLLAFGVGAPGRSARRR